MRPNMKDLLMNTAGRTRTENGAVTNATTGSDVLNLFALGGAVRGRSVADVTNLVAAAYREDRDLALRVMFYLGDIREGQGERDFLFNSLRLFITLCKVSINCRLFILYSTNSNGKFH